LKEVYFGIEQLQTTAGTNRAGARAKANVRPHWPSLALQASMEGGLRLPQWERDQPNSMPA
jgi:hypothetical protein